MWTINQPTSLAAKLMLAFTILVTVVMGVVMAYWLNSQRQSAEEELETRATQMAELLGKTVAGPLWNIDLKSIHDQLASVMADPQVHLVEIHVPGRDRPVASEKHDQPAPDGIEREVPITYVRNQPPLSVEIGKVRLIYTRFHLHQMLARTRLMIVTVVLIMLTSLSICTFFLLRRMVKRPVGTLAAMAQRVAEGDFKTGIAVSSRDELGTLATAFNSMRAQLGALVESLEQRNEQLSREIAERVRVEMDLRKSEEFLSNVVENIPDMVFVKDAEALRFVRFNRAGEELLGYSRDELIGKSDYDLFPQKEADFFTSKDREVLRDKRLFDIPEEPVQTKSGGRILHTKKMPILDCEGNPQYLLGISEDITERKHTEEELKRHRDHLEELVRERTAELTIAKEAAEKANQAKSAFLSSMSHELRTPLNAILGYAQILKRQKNLTEKQQQQLDILRSSGEHLLTLINDILDMGKIEAQQVEINEAVFALPALLRQMFEIARLKGEDRELRFEYEALSPLPEFVRGDERKLRQVLLNLLSNAVKYTPKGDVTLRVNYERTGPGHFLLEVVDTGLGIPKDKQEQIFEPFTQLAVNGQVREGTGLGLTITRELISLMGGTLEVESEPGEGSTFRVGLILPAALAQGLPVEQIEHAVIGYKGKRRAVLVVDDNITNVSMLVSLLEPLGFEVLTADGGREGLRQALERKPDLILLDLVMPGLDGLDVAEGLREHRELDKTRILGISATVSDTDRKKAFEETCDGFLGKPIRTTLLFQKMHEMLGLEWEREAAVVPEAASPPEEEESMRMPPREEMRELLDLARMGDVRKIGAWASRLEEKNGEYGPFARKLLRLAGEYKINAMLALVERHMAKEE